MGDPMLRSYDQRELEIAGEFLSNWLPFLTAGICPSCASHLTRRVHSLLPNAPAAAPPVEQVPLQRLAVMPPVVMPGGWVHAPMALLPEMAAAVLASRWGLRYQSVEPEMTAAPSGADLPPDPVPASPLVRRPPNVYADTEIRATGWDELPGKMPTAPLVLAPPVSCVETEIRATGWDEPQGKVPTSPLLLVPPDVSCAETETRATRWDEPQGKASTAPLLLVTPDVSSAETEIRATGWDAPAENLQEVKTSSGNVKMDKGLAPIRAERTSLVAAIRAELKSAPVSSTRAERASLVAATKAELKPAPVSSDSAKSPLERMSWADMAVEDELAESASGNEENDQMELKLFRSVVRRKDFVCFERVRGKEKNILAGLELHTGVFSTKEQDEIVACVYDLQEKGRKGELGEHTYSEPRKWMKGKGRVTLQFGCCYNYATDKEGNPPGILPHVLSDPLPPLFKAMIKKMVRWHVLPTTCIPDSCIVNIYDRDDCIPPHIDSHDFVRPFCTVSFLSECDILFGASLKSPAPGEFTGEFALPLPVGSVLIFNGNGADVAKHCVPAVPNKRISITFRRMQINKRPDDYSEDLELQGIVPLRDGPEERSVNTSSRIQQAALQTEWRSGSSGGGVLRHEALGLRIGQHILGDLRSPSTQDPPSQSQQQTGSALSELTEKSSRGGSSTPESARQPATSAPSKRSEIPRYSTRARVVKKQSGGASEEKPVN